MSLTSGPICVAARVNLLAADHGDDIAFADDRVRRRLDDAALAAQSHDEGAQILRKRLQLRDGLSEQLRIGDTICPHVEGPGGGPRPLGGTAGGSRLAAHAGRLVLQIYAHQLRSDGGYEPDQHGRSDEVRHGISDWNIVHQSGLFGVSDRQSIDRLARGADDGRFRERSGKQTGCSADVVAEQFRHEERGQKAGHAKHDRERDLRQGVRLQSSKELRAHLVAGRE